MYKIKGKTKSNLLHNNILYNKDEIIEIEVDKISESLQNFIEIESKKEIKKEKEPIKDKEISKEKEVNKEIKKAPKRI